MKRKIISGRVVYATLVRTARRRNLRFLFERRVDHIVSRCKAGAREGGMMSVIRQIEHGNDESSSSNGGKSDARMTASTG